MVEFVIEFVLLDRVRDIWMREFMREEDMLQMEFVIMRLHD